MRALLLVSVFTVGSVSSALPWSVTSANNDFSDVPSAIILPFPEDSTPVLGQGFDTLTNVRKPSKCIDHGSVERANLNNRSSSLDETVDDYSLWTKSNTSIKAKAKYSGWSGGGAYESSVETTTASRDVSVLVKASTELYSLYIDIPADANRLDGVDNRIDLSASATKLMDENPIRFRKVCGDSYVAQITYGSDFYATFNFSNLEFEQRRDLKMSLDVAGPGDVFSAEANTQFQSTLKQLSQKTSLRVSERGTDAAALPTKQEELVALYQSFMTRSENGNRPLYIVVVPYTNLPNSERDRLPEYRTYVERLVRAALRFKSILRDLDVAIIEREIELADTRSLYIRIPELEVGPRTLSGMKTMRSDILSKYTSIKKSLDSCLTEDVYEDPDSCVKIDIPDDSKYRAEMPVPRNYISKSDLDVITNGAQSGDPFKTNAACRFARIISVEQLRRVFTNRCETLGECSDEESMESSDRLAFSSVGVSKELCNAALTLGEDADQVKLNAINSIRSVSEFGHPREFVPTDATSQGGE